MQSKAKQSKAKKGQANPSKTKKRSRSKRWAQHECKCYEKILIHEQLMDLAWKALHLQQPTECLTRQLFTFPFNVSSVCSLKTPLYGCRVHWIRHRSRSRQRLWKQHEIGSPTFPYSPKTWFLLVLNVGLCRYLIQSHFREAWKSMALIATAIACIFQQTPLCQTISLSTLPPVSGWVVPGKDKMPTKAMDRLRLLRHEPFLSSRL